MENIFFILLIAVVGLVKWLVQAAENKRNAEAERHGDTPPPRPAAATPVAPGTSSTEEERIRKFLEALGVPSTSHVPPNVRPRQVTPQAPRPQGRILPVDPFPTPRGIVRTPSPIPAAPPPLPPTATAVVEATPPPGAARSAKRLARSTKSATSSGFDVQELGEARPDEIVRKSDSNLLVTRLATPQGLRDAIVLREIFGPPRSMQPIGHAPVG